MSDRPRLNDVQLRCLNALDGCSDPEWQYASFAPVMKITGLPRPEVRRAIRSLARKGLAEYSAALCTEDGDFAGAGYRITIAGRKLLLTMGAEANDE